MANVPSINPVTMTANATSAGVVTVPDTSIGWRKGAQVTLTNSTPLSQAAILIDILSKTTLYVRLLPQIPEGSQVAVDTPGISPFNLSAYTTSLSSTIAQLPMDVGDAVLGRGLFAMDAKGMMAPVSGASVNNTTVLGPVIWSPDFTNGNCIILLASGSDSSVSVPAGNYYLFIGGVPIYINFNAASSSSSPLIPVGGSSNPIYIGNSGGSEVVLHASTASGNATVSLIPAKPTLVY